MTQLTVLCDDCFTVWNPPIPMDRIGAKELVGFQFQYPLGDTYICSCGRLYGDRIGYFNFTQNDGPQRNRAHPRCDGRDCNQDPMYLKSVGKNGLGIFACPRCGHEREEKIGPTV